MQHSRESLRALAKRYGVDPKTVAKWKARSSGSDLPRGPKEPRSTVLSAEEEAVVGAFRRHILSPLDDCLYALQPTVAHLTRSSSAAPDIKAALDVGEPVWAHAFEYACEYACAQNDIDHRLTKPKHPWTNGQVERMNRTIKDATAKRYFYETHDQLRTHLQNFVAA
jgi:transposase InsO family protein